MERRLAAILMADVVGYSRLMEMDEAGTFSTLKARKHDILAPSVAHHHGRLVKEMGDGVLVEFGSAVEAVGCALDLQKQFAEANSGLPEERSILLRIGVNLGDVIVEESDIYGDGVNVAARLEGLSDAGGICISGKVYQEVHNKLDVGYTFLGDKSIKNISSPIPVYKIRLDPAAQEVNAGSAFPIHRRPVAILAMVTAVLLIAGVGVIWALWRTQVATEPSAAHQISDSPSIAVLPFRNMSDNASESYFAEGIAEDLITDLSKISELFIIASNTSFRYGDTDIDIREVGRKLGVGYILEGSVRRSADRVRINAQLVDTSTGSHIWAQRYDGSPADVFGLQDQVTASIIDALKLQLTVGERQAVDARGTDVPAAYDAYLRGLRALAERRRIDIDANQAAQIAFEEAIKLDPDYALAYAGLGWTRWLYYETINSYNEEVREEAFKLARKSIELSDNALAHRVLAREHFTLLAQPIAGLGGVRSTKNTRLAVVELETSAKLQPNDPDVLADLASVYCFTGMPKAALKLVRRAMELNPNHPEWYFAASGMALLFTGEPQRAAIDLKAWSGVDPAFPTPYLFLAAALAISGDIPAAKITLQRFDSLTYGPFGSSSSLASITWQWPMASEQQEVLLDALHRAGMD